jgi:hypothetical protein
VEVQKGHSENLNETNFLGIVGLMLTKGQTQNLNETNFMGNVGLILTKSADTENTSGDFFNTSYSYQRMEKDYYLKNKLPEIKNRTR